MKSQAPQITQIACFCGQFDEQFDPVYQCYECDLKCHKVCYEIDPMDNQKFFYCIRCRLMIGEPFRQIEKYIGLPKPIWAAGEYQYEIDLDYSDFAKIRNHSLQQKLVIYCMPIKSTVQQKKNNHIYQWPSDNIAMTVNAEIMCYESFYFSEIPARIIMNPEQSKKNILKFKLNEKLKIKSLIGVGLAKIIKQETMSSMIINLNVKKDEQSEQTWDQMYKEWIQDNEEIGTFISFKDPITFKKINIPMRGDDCSHYNMLDLETYLNFYQNSDKNERWQCPICDKKIYWNSITIDFYFYSIIKKIEEKYKNSLEKLAEVKEIKLYSLNGEIQYEEILEVKKYQNQDENIKQINSGLLQSDIMDIEKSNEEENKQQNEGNNSQQNQIQALKFFSNQNIKIIQNTDKMKKLKRKFEELVNQYNLKNNNQSYKKIIEEASKEPDFQRLSPIEALILFDQIYNYKKRFQEDKLQQFNQQQKTIKQQIQYLTLQQHYFIISTFALAYAQSFENLVEFTVLVVSEGRSVLGENQQMEMEQITRILVILMTITDQIIQSQNPNYLEIYSDHYNANGKKIYGCILGALVRVFCVHFNLYQNITVAKIIFYVTGIINDLKFLPQKGIQESKIEDNVINSSYFLFEVMRDKLFNIEEEWIPLLQLIYNPPQSNIENVDEQKETFQFVCFLKIMFTIVYMYRQKQQQQYVRVKQTFSEELERIVLLWDEDQHVKQLVSKEKWSFEGFGDFIKYIKQK